MLLHFDQLSQYGETSSLAREFSGNENDASCDIASCPGFNDAGGRFAGAHSYTPNDFFSVPHHGTVSFPDVLTVAVWFYPRSFPTNWRPLVAKVASGSSAANFWLGHQDNTFCVLFNSAGDWQTGCSPVGYATHQWYLVVGTWDDPNDRFRAFVNGVPVVEHSRTVDMPEVSVPITIGYAPGDDGVDGVIDEVIIWNRVLSDQEIQALYSPP